MKQELKIRIHNYKLLEKKLKNLGALFIFDTFFVDTYFKSPENKVLKIVENIKGASIVAFEKKENKFSIVKRERITNPDEVIETFTNKYGLDCVLQGLRKEYVYNQFDITFNVIDDVGEFLIVVGEEGQKQFIEETLQIENPEYITVPFNALPKQQ